MRVKYLRWLQGALYGNRTLADRCRINKEARSLYHTIWRNSGKLIQLKHLSHHYQSITPLGMLKPAPQIFIKSYTNPNPAQPVVLREPLLPPSRKPNPCAPDERIYYQTIHGFDPEAGWDGQHRRYCYNEWFSLRADPQLSVVGVTIGARVEQVPGGPPMNRILFRNKDGRETGVYCTHTVLYAGPADDALRFADDSILQHAPVQSELDFLAKTGGPVQLPPWGHFAALKSYVAGIAELGILAMLGMASGAERVGDYKAKSSVGLKMHLARKHEIGVQWHVCPRCGYAAKRKSDLTDHLAIVHGIGVKWHLCPYCDYKAKFNRYLTRHLASVHNIGEKRFSCPHCSYKSNDSGNMKRHISRIYGTIACK